MWLPVFCTTLISCFPGTLLRYFLNDFEMVPVVPIITGITFVFTALVIIIIIIIIIINIIIIIIRALASQQLAKDRTMEKSNLTSSQWLLDNFSLVQTICGPITF